MFFFFFFFFGEGGGGVEISLLGDKKTRAVNPTKDFFGNNCTNSPYFEEEKKLSLSDLDHSF